MRVLFVGPVSGYTSYPVVSKGLLRAMIEANLQPVVADVTWDGSPDHTDPYFEEEADSIIFLQQAQVLDLVQKGIMPFSHITKCVAVNPSYHLMQIKDHGIEVAGMFVGDVDKIPDSWQEIMKKQDVILTPSTWCRNVIQSSGIKNRVIVLNHGVSPAFVPNAEACPPEEKFTFLHLCSAVFYPQRKGTPQVIEAFDMLINDGYYADLKIVFGMKSRPVRQLLKKCSEKNIKTYFFDGARPQDEIKKSYESCHVGIFPSRAEGFSMCPLEFRAIEQPVAMTFCTGHRDHLDPDDNPARWGIVEIPSGPMAPAWGKFGNAPEVSAEDVYRSMKTCISQYENLKDAAVDMAEAVRAQWSWEATTSPLIEWISK
jgi:glycosyltransferase involved in cell wall biosynthesis